MLVLTRYAGQRIIIDTGTDTIAIEVLSIRGAKVVLGTSAPDSVRVDREEVALARAATARAQVDRPDPIRPNGDAA